MASVVRGTCAEHGSEDFLSSELTIYRRDNGEALASWRCSTGLRNFTEINEVFVARLKMFGCKESPLPVIRELTGHVGPAVTLDDVLALHNELEMRGAECLSDLQGSS